VAIPLCRSEVYPLGSPSPPLGLQPQRRANGCDAALPLLFPVDDLAAPLANVAVGLLLVAVYDSKSNFAVLVGLLGHSLRDVKVAFQGLPQHSREGHKARRVSALLGFIKPAPKFRLQFPHLGKQGLGTQGVLMLLRQGQLVGQVLLVAEKRRGTVSLRDALHLMIHRMCLLVGLTR